MLKRTRDAHTPRCTSGDCSHSAAPPRHAKCCGTARAGIRTCLYMSMRPARARTCALRERSTTRPTPAPHIPAHPNPELQSQFASVVLRHPRPLHAAAYRACPYMSGGYPNQPKPLPKSRRSPSSSSRLKAKTNVIAPYPPGGLPGGCPYSLGPHGLGAHAPPHLPRAPRARLGRTPAAGVLSCSPMPPTCDPNPPAACI